jgi:long-chain acyl-CoA synthetase
MDVSNPGEPWRDHYAHACAWDEEFPPLSLVELFAASVAEHPDRPLVEFEGRQFSYVELFAEARRFAAGLQAQGVGMGERVGLFLPNVPTYVPAYYGALMAGATVVNFSPLYTATELEAQVVDSGARILVTLDVPALLPTALEVLRDSPLQQLIVQATSSGEGRGMDIRNFRMWALSKPLRVAGSVLRAEDGWSVSGSNWAHHTVLLPF